MSIYFGKLLPGLATLRHLVTQRQVVITSIIGKRFIYDTSVFGFDKFDELRKNTANLIDAEARKNLTLKMTKFNEDPGVKSLSSSSSTISVDDLNNFLLLTNNDEDLNLLIRSFKKFKRLSMMDKDTKLGEKLIKLCLLMKKTDKIEELLNDKDLQTSLVDQLNSFLIMNQLLVEKMYPDVVRTYEKYIEHLDLDAQVGKNSRSSLKKQTQPIPFGNLKLVIEALLLINTKESFEKMKEIVSTAAKLNSVPNNTSIACCFLLAINQKEYKFAYEIVLKISKWNRTLINNLKAIALCKLNRQEEAYYFMEEIVNMPDASGHSRRVNELDGKLFKLTLDSFKETFASANQNDIKRYTQLYERAQQKLFERDLHDYCVNVNKKRF